MVDTNKLHKQIVALEKGDDATRRLTIQALKEHDAEEWAAAPADAVKDLVESLQHQLQSGIKPPFMHKEVAIILGNLGQRSKVVVPQLVELLQDGVPDPVREAASVALGKIGKDAKSAVDKLIALSTGRTNLAIQAVRALSEIGCADQRVRTALVNLWLSPLQTQNSHVQVAIALCKLKIEAKGLLSILANTIVANQDVALRKSAAEALLWCNKNDLDVVPSLLTATLNDKNDDVRAMAQAALDQMKVTPEKAVQLCAKQLKESVYAEMALRKSGALAVPALMDVLAENDPDTRVKAVRTLGTLGEVALAAVPAITKVLQDRDPEVRLAAAKGLWNINKNADAVVPVLVHLLEEKRPADTADAESRRRFLQTVIEALWRIGPPAKAAMPALTVKAKDKNRLVSESASNAMKKIATA